MSRSEDGYIRTFTGTKVYPLDPDPSTIHIEDIAHSLSNQCRWTGHPREVFTVGQHSVMVSWITAEGTELEGLLHDASEAYLSDIARPVKRHEDFLRFYREAEERLERCIAEKFKLTYPWPESVHLCDEILLNTEDRDFMGGGSPGDLVLDKRLDAWSHERTKREFLRRYVELTGADIVVPDEKLFKDGKLKQLYA